MTQKFPPSTFEPKCRLCPRLAEFLDSQREAHPGYHNAPVAQFGAADARFLIVGLAPGLHGANATGRPFTGDHAGLILYKTLHACGFASKPTSDSATDGLRLIDCRISNSVKCVPPENKPLPVEIRTCNRYLKAEFTSLPMPAVILALGTIAHNAALEALGEKSAKHKFSHGAEHILPNGAILLDSYHCSRYNTQTRRLTEAMFVKVMSRARELVDGDR